MILPTKFELIWSAVCLQMHRNLLTDLWPGNRKKNQWSMTKSESRLGRPIMHLPTKCQSNLIITLSVNAGKLLNQSETRKAVQILRSTPGLLAIRWVVCPERVETTKSVMDGWTVGWTDEWMKEQAHSYSPCQPHPQRSWWQINTIWPWKLARAWSPMNKIWVLEPMI